MVEEYLRDLKLIIVINGSDSFIPPVVCVQICLHTKQSTGGAGSYSYIQSATNEANPGNELYTKALN